MEQDANVGDLAEQLGITQSAVSHQLNLLKSNKLVNGYSHKSVNTAYGKMDVSVPRDREGSFEPKAIPKRTKDVSGIVCGWYSSIIACAIAAPFVFCLFLRAISAVPILSLIPKRTKDVSGIEDKVLSMYARGMSQRDIADTVEDIYGFDISHETISTITDRVIKTAQEWQNRPLKKFYTFLFVDCIYVTISFPRARCFHIPGGNPFHPGAWPQTSDRRCP